MTPEERYGYISDWAGRARGTNPNVFDELTEPLLKNGEWSEDEFVENEKLFKSIVGGFLRQNKLLNAELSKLEPSGVVNTAVFDALNCLNDEFMGKTHADLLKEAVEAVFNDFGALRSTDIRRKFAGSVTGSAGTDSVEVFGYVNFLRIVTLVYSVLFLCPDLWSISSVTAG